MKNPSFLFCLCPSKEVLRPEKKTNSNKFMLGLLFLVLSLSYWISTIAQGQRGCTLTARINPTEGVISSLNVFFPKTLYAFLQYYHWTQYVQISSGETSTPGIASQEIKRISLSPAVNCWVIVPWTALYDEFIVCEFRYSSNSIG